MKTKIVGILVCMLLIATTFPVFGMEIDDKVDNSSIEDCSDVIDTESNPPQFPLIWWLGVDQEQTSNCGSGMQIRPPLWHAQSFKPTKEKLIGVELQIFKYGNPPAGIEITVSIRENINGSDLTEKTVDADQITGSGIWVLFDFPDITVTPENTYYIVCRATGGDATNAYCWLFDLNNSYDRGEAWISDDDDATWTTLWEWWNYNPDWPEPDFCFKTYHSKFKDKPYNMNMLFLRFLENHPHMFPILRHMLGF